MSLILFVLIAQTLVAYNKFQVTSRTISTCIDDGTGVGCLTYSNATNTERLFYKISKRLVSPTIVPFTGEGIIRAARRVNNKHKGSSGANKNTKPSSNHRIFMIESIDDEVKENSTLIRQSANNSKKNVAKNGHLKRAFMIQVRALQLPPPPPSSSKEENMTTVDSTNSKINQHPLILFLTKNSASGSSTPQAPTESPYSRLLDISSLLVLKENRSVLTTTVTKSPPKNLYGSFVNFFWSYFTTTTPSSIEQRNSHNRRQFANKKIITAN